MGKVTTNALLLTALALPVVLFWQLGAHAALSTVVAAAVAVGWALNVAWAFSANKAIVQDASPGNAGNLKIALAFGWACPVVLVLLTWLVLRFFAPNVT
jgi:hypothetical protein